MNAPIAAIYAAVLGLGLILLSYRVVRLRRRLRIGIGTGENPELALAIRVHGNFVEHVPLAVILLVLFELNGGPAWAVHLGGAVLLVARLLHATGLGRSAGRTFGRFWGVLATWGVLAGLAIANLMQALA